MWIVPSKRISNVGRNVFGITALLFSHIIWKSVRKVNRFPEVLVNFHFFKKWHDGKLDKCQKLLYDLKLKLNFNFKIGIQ